MLQWLGDPKRLDSNGRVLPMLQASLAITPRLLHTGVYDGCAPERQLSNRGLVALANC